MALEHEQHQNRVWIPTEIIVKILLQLPVLTLLRCKSVCKLWHSLISEQSFIKSHLSLAPRNPHYQLISFDDHSKSFLLYDHVMFGKSVVNVVELDNPFTPKGATPSIIGSCNGLLCINISVKGFSTFFIWNPSTRRVNRLPSNEFVSLDGFGFGYDEFNDDYKVVEITSGYPIPRGKPRVKICSLKSGYWKTLICDLTCYYILQLHGIILNGALHWITVHRDPQSIEYLRTIISFDLATETFGTILQPVYNKRYNDLTLCTFGDWLSMVCYLSQEKRSDVWVMKVYGVQDSWIKLVSIPHVTLTIVPLNLMTLCVTHDGKYLLILEKELVLYDPKNSSFSEIQKIDTYNISSHVESLVSPMPRDGTSRDTHGFFNTITVWLKKYVHPVIFCHSCRCPMYIKDSGFRILSLFGPSKRCFHFLRHRSFNFRLNCLF